MDISLGKINPVNIVPSDAACGIKTYRMPRLLFAKTRSASY